MIKMALLLSDFQKEERGKRLSAPVVPCTNLEANILTKCSKMLLTSDFNTSVTSGSAMTKQGRGVAADMPCIHHIFTIFFYSSCVKYNILNHCVYQTFSICLDTIFSSDV